MTALTTTSAVDPQFRIGNACRSDEALVGLWFGVRSLRSDPVEDDESFTWTGTSHAAPLVPVYHALLGLAFGSSTVAASKSNATGLRLLSTFLHWHPDVLRAARPDPQVWLVADPVTVAHGDGSSLTDALRMCGDRLLRGRQAIDVATVAEIEQPGAQRWSCGILSTTHWIVAGGISMSKRVQRALAARVRAGDRCTVTGPLPACDENGSYCNELALALAVGEPWFGSNADAGRDDADLAARPRRLVLSFLRSDPDSGSAVLYLFSRTDTEVVHRENVGGVPVTARLCPRGAAVVVLRRGKLTGFCVKAINEITGESGQVDLAAGDDRVRLASPADAVGRLTNASWKIALYGRARAMTS